LSWRVVCGPTGSGKSRLLHRLRDAGAQVLDLEALAAHRGSVLGLVPGTTQPTQKAFDTRIWHALRGFDTARPVFVESESKKIGRLRVPEMLVLRMRESPCLWLELGLEARVRLLMDEYDFFVQDSAAFCTQLDALRVLRGNEVVNRWQDQANAGQHAAVVRELLADHYDPIYLQSMQRNFTSLRLSAEHLQWDGSEASLAEVVQQALQWAQKDADAAGPSRSDAGPRADAGTSPALSAGPSQPG
jgi:tRNA 2-selenouridine synthase